MRAYVNNGTAPPADIISDDALYIRGLNAGKEEIESLSQQLAECQAAIKASNEALESIKVHLELPVTNRVLVRIADRALAIQPNQEALHEWGARLLDSIASSDVLPNYSSNKLCEIADQLRKGEWRP